VSLTSAAVQDDLAALKDHLDKIFAQWELMESDNVPISEALPVKLFAPDMEQLVSMTSTSRNLDHDVKFGDDEGVEFGDDEGVEFQI
jgi:hypothetical protein